MSKSPDVQSVLDWLMDGAKSVHAPQDVLLELCQRLTACGLPIYRAAVFVTTLHPNVAGRGFFWREGWTEVEVGEASYEMMKSDLYLKNPIYRVFRDGEPIRRRLSDPDCAIDYPILEDLRDEGVTDYIAQPLDFINGEIHAASYTTRQQGGFTDAEMDALNRLRPALARIAEIYALTRTARNLLDAYLGHQSGEKVLKGQIQRGDGQDVHAVFWFCDLRNSTPLANSMSRSAFLALLNDYFECMAGAVLDGGGEVLRFIGDAVLAIFPVSDDGATAAEACAKAEAAVKDAVRRMDVLNVKRQGFGYPPLGYGIGLHLGDVTYGNIGTPERIEFTVIGAAANEAARIESLCKTLGVAVLASDRVVEHMGSNWRSLGDQELRGVADKIEVFTPDIT
jgi:adenylate cyclase